ncbi:MAG: alanine racemase, partial [Puniceicoccales bacterium]|nr:alanine racemase [Puniceicoccales bacterium]
MSYNRTRTLRRDTRIAVVTAGYGDGIPLAASDRAQVLIRGQRRQVLGRVTMDQTIVDVSETPEVSAGDVATFIGRQDGGEISVSEFC